LGAKLRCNIRRPLSDLPGISGSDVTIFPRNLRPCFGCHDDSRGCESITTSHFRAEREGITTFHFRAEREGITTFHFRAEREGITTFHFRAEREGITTFQIRAERESALRRRRSR
jgi:NAD(P)H-flavin reductase